MSSREDATSNAANLRRQLTVRSRERCLNKLRSEDPDKLLQFCKLHISILTDMGCSSSFDELFGDKQPATNKNKISNLLARKKSNSIGGSLDEQCDSPGRESPSNLNIEPAVMQLVSLLKKSQNLSHEGIFRKTGNIGRQKELKQKLLCESVNLQDESCSIHDYASVLKSILSELAEPLLHERFIKAHLFSLRIPKAETRINVVNLLLQMMSLSHYAIAKAVFTLLHRVTTFAPQNRMDADNLGSIFAPHILCPKKATATELQAMTCQAQAVVAFIITNAPQLFQPSELLAMDAANHIRKSRLAMNTSEDSIMSFESVHSSGSRSSRKHKLSRGEEFCEDPIDTVIAFADRGKSQNNTELEVAKLYSYVHSLPDSEKQKQMFMKRIKENKPSCSPTEEKRRSRSSSLGRSIKRHLSRRRKRSQSNSRDMAKLSSPLIEDQTDSPQVNSEKSSETMTIDPLQKSPYAFHRSSLKNLRDKDTDSSEVIVNPSALGAQHLSADTAACQRLTESPSREEANASPVQPVPSIRKPLISSNLPTSSEKTRLLKKTKPSTQLVHYQLLSSARDYQATPPRPTKKMSVVDSNLIF